MARASHEVKVALGDPIETLKRCGGYYECPKNPTGSRLGPLVAYAGKYTDAEGVQKSYVGDAYYNFAKAEEYPHVMDHFAETLVWSFLRAGEEDVFLGAPMGGILFAAALARILDSRVVFVEKKTVKPSSGSKREETEIVWGRHEIKNGDRVIITEDVCNNFSTTQKLIDLIEGVNGSVIGVACILNRSPRSSYKTTGNQELQVLSLLHIPTRQYKQDDPEVKGSIEKGLVVWEPKKEWGKLQQTMEEAANQTS